MTEPRVDPERMAALLDGRIDAREREALLAQLAASEEDLAVFADAAAVLSELEREGTAEASGAAVSGDDTPASAALPQDFPESAAAPASPVEVQGALGGRRWFRSPALPLALAAMIALVIVVPVARRAFGPAPADPARLAILAAQGQPLANLAGTRMAWPESRGAPADIPPAVVALRLGARLVDLQLAFAARDTAAPTIARDIVRLLQGAPVGQGVSGEYARLAGGDPGVTDAELRQAARDVMAVAGEDYVRLGALAQAARVAASARNAEFFRDESVKSALKHAEAIPNLSGDTRAALLNLGGAAAAPSPTAWRDVEAAAHQILRSATGGPVRGTPSGE